MTAIDNIKAALEAGVTGYATGDDWMAIGGNTVMLNSGRPVWARIATCEHAPNAAYIAACNPSAIRELLAYVESQERERAEDQGVIAVWRRRTQEAEAKVESLEKDAGRYRSQFGARGLWDYSNNWCDKPKDVVDVLIDTAKEQTK